MVTVEADAGDVEQRLAEGLIGCPGCGAALAGWGWARPRVVREVDRVRRVVPRRARCRGCRVTHVLLPLFVLLRRADSVEVIGAAIGARVAGAGARTIAAALGRPVETVRGWLRRLAGRLDLVRGWFTAVAVGVAVDPGGRRPGGGPAGAGGHGVVPLPAGSAWADLLTAVQAAVRAVAARFGTVSVSVWWAAGAMSSGQLLAPSWPSDSRPVLPSLRLATRVTSARGSAR